MKNRGKFLALLLVCLCLVSGCQLAREDMGENAQEDRQIGAFITREHLDLFDAEQYLNDNAARLTRGEQLPEAGSKYQGRLWATLSDVTLTDEATGRTTQIKEYVFEGVEGICYFAPTIQDGGEAYIASSSDEAISHGHMGINVGDGTEGINLRATIYSAPGRGGDVFYINPVYQTADGDVYAVTGHGISLTGVQDEGAVFTQTEEQNITITRDKERISWSFRLEIALDRMIPPEKIVVREMDEESRVLSRTEYAPGELPQTLQIGGETAFLLVETHKQGGRVKRALYDAADETMETFRCREDGICIAQTTRLQWAE